MVPRIIRLFILSLTAGIYFSLASCYYDNGDTIYPKGPNDCDTSSITFSADILPIIQDNCISCHNHVSFLGSVNLEGYNNVAVYANNGLLVGSIRHYAGFRPMPDGQPMLDECSIESVEAWVRNGVLNN